MPTHPLPPEDFDQLARAYVQTGQAILDLGFTCREADFDKPTQLPGWTVKDLFAHIAGLGHYLIGYSDPDVEVPDYPWITSNSAQFLQKAVEVRRSRSGPEVVQEWQQVFNVRQQMLRDPDVTETTEVRGPVGPLPLGVLLRQRTAELWVHEQDLRAVLDRPGNLDSPGAALFTTQVLAAFPGNVAGRTDLPEATTVIVESTGPVQARVGVHLSVGADGRRVGQPLFTGEDRVDDETGEVAPLKPGSITSIRLSTDALTRRAAGRVPTAELRYTVEGNDAVAAQVLDAIVITP